MPSSNQKPAWQREQTRPKIGLHQATNKTWPRRKPAVPPASARPASPVSPRYKWIALSNTTLGMLMATINSSIMLIALPDIFRGIGINPLQPGNTTILLWMMMGFLVVTGVLVVSFGRLGDMFGRVRMYNMGFAIFALFSILLSVTWMQGAAAGWYLIVMRLLQGVGGAMLMANSSAILTDACPHNERGLALGLNQVAGIAGSFIGLVLGGVLGPLSWRYVFLVSVPFGVIGTIWSNLKLRELGVRRPARLARPSNLTFGAGLIAVLAGITYGIQPYGGAAMGWTSPLVLGLIGGGLAVLAVFCVIETRAAEPMFRLSLFRIRAFTAGNLASLLSGLGRGRHERDVPELGPGAVHRHLLHADHPGPGRVIARDPHPRPGGAGRAARGRGAGGRAAAGIAHVRGAARLQPGADRARARAHRAPRQSRRLPHRAFVLPVADLGAVLPRPGHRVRLRDRGLPDRGLGVAAARRPVRPRTARGADGPGHGARRGRGRRLRTSRDCPRDLHSRCIAGARYRSGMRVCRTERTTR